MSCSGFPASNTVRIFLSSTFRDFGEERDLLVRRVFPALRGRLKSRFVELVDVDLRWGITAEEAERGEVLPICLAEIDRSRPFFVGLLGERYGWMPSTDQYASDLLERQPWLDELRGGKSVTELEILHGVLNDPNMAGHALFYFRSSVYAGKKGGDYLPETDEDTARLRALKDRIRQSGFPVVEDYEDPEALAARLENDLWPILDEMYPADEVPDAFEREQRRHDAYAAPRRRLYLGGDQYRRTLDQALAKGAQRLVIEGQSGGGKSALISNWLADRQEKHPEDLIHVHYSGASADAVDPVSLVRRLCEGIKLRTGSAEEIPSDPQMLLQSLSLWLAYASAYASKQEKSWLIVLDALNALTDIRDLRWFPEFLPEGVHFVVSSLPGEVLEALKRKGEWEAVVVAPLNKQEAARLLTDYLKIYNKTLQPELIKQIIDHPLSTNPLFLRTLAEELRLFGVYEDLSQHLDFYLESKTVDDLFERVLARVEGDCGETAVQRVLEGIWASRAGLTEEEIREYAQLPPAAWAQIRYALDDALLESGGRITFAHDFLRIAVSDRYLAGNNELVDDDQSEEAIKLRVNAHRNLAEWFEKRSKKIGVVDARAAEEIPYQWRRAKDWERLKTCLTTRDMFEAIYANQSNAEHLSHWLTLEYEIGVSFEDTYEKIWQDWIDDASDQETEILAEKLHDLLYFSGRFGSFTVRLARIQVDLLETLLGPNNAGTAGALHNLAMLLRDKGYFEEAEALLHRVIAIRENVLGPEDPDTAASIQSYATLLRDKGEYVAAEQFFRRALAIAERNQELKQSFLARCLNGLAGLLQCKAEYGAAELLYRRALDIDEKINGRIHWDTAGTLNNLGSLFCEKGDYKSAEEFLRRALSIAEKALGDSHPDTENILHNLASVLKNCGDHENAELLYLKALRIAENIEGPDHLSTSTTLRCLSNLYIKKNDYEKAENLLQRSLSILENNYGASHPDAITIMQELAKLYTESGKLSEADSLYQRVIALVKEKSDNDEDISVSLLINYGYHQRLSGFYDIAEVLYRRALSICDKQGWIDHPHTAQCLINLKALLNLLGRAGDGRSMLSRGDFISIVGYAKAFCICESNSELLPIHFLYGAMTAAKEDNVWGEQINKEMSACLKQHIADKAKANLIDLRAQLVPVDCKIPLSKVLRKIINANSHSNLNEFIKALAGEEFPDSL